MTWTCLQRIDGLPFGASSASSVVFDVSIVFAFAV